MRFRRLAAIGALGLSLMSASCADSSEPTIETSDEQATNCDPNYTGCVPLVPYDLDCADIARSVEVIGDDVHGFDGDGDGYGCETYG
jgi:hypothetical protein